MSTIINNHIEDMIEDVKGGHLEALKAYADLKLIEQKIKGALIDIYDEAIEEANRHGKQFSEHGYKFEIRNGKSTYSYKHLPEWNTAKDFIKELEDKHKQAFLEHQKGRVIVDDSGEQITPAQVSYSKDVIVLRKL